MQGPDTDRQANNLTVVFASGGGPIIPGTLFPFLFITIACGAISGFHSLIGSGTTPKMIDKESHIRPIGYGAMLIEGMLALLAVATVAVLAKGAPDLQAALAEAREGAAGLYALSVADLAS